MAERGMRCLVSPVMAEYLVRSICWSNVKANRLLVLMKPRKIRFSIGLNEQIFVKNRANSLKDLKEQIILAEVWRRKQKRKSVSLRESR